MGKFSTLSVATSGLMAAQAGLYVTGHNMANVDTVGYTRQQAVQKDFMSQNITRALRAGNQTGRGGVNGMQIGLGTDVAAIRQIRDKFLDISYRAEAGRYEYYLVKSNVGAEMEAILGELQSQYNTDSVIKDLFNSLQELSFDPSGLAARGLFISTAVTFIDKVSNVFNRMLEYQYNLNDQVITVTQRINQLANEIEKYNRLIMDAEMRDKEGMRHGDNANDYRDSRAVCIDELSHLLNIEVKEQPNGRVDITAEGKQLVVTGIVNQLGFRYCGPNNSLVEPVFTTSDRTLSWDDATVVPLFDWSKPVNAIRKNDSGYLKSLLVCRGFYLTTYASTEFTPAQLSAMKEPKPSTPPPAGGYNGGDGSDWDNYYEYQNAIKNNFNLQNCFMPQVMKKFDEIVHTIVTMINDAVAPYVTGGSTDPNAPFGLDLDPITGLYHNKGGVEIFKRRYFDRFDPPYDPVTGTAAGNYVPEDPSEYFTLYSSGNLVINPLLLQEGGYNYIALMTRLSDAPTDEAPQGLTDNTLVLNGLLAKWKGKFDELGGLSVDDAYKNFINLLGIETSEAMTYTEEQSVLLVGLDNKRMTISAVSLDEEMRNMMIYQHAYNAAARVINTVDSMIDKIVNGTGRAGL